MKNNIGSNITTLIFFVLMILPLQGALAVGSPFYYGRSWWSPYDKGEWFDSSDGDVVHNGTGIGPTDNLEQDPSCVSGLSKVTQQCEDVYQGQVDPNSVTYLIRETTTSINPFYYCHVTAICVNIPGEVMQSLLNP